MKTRWAIFLAAVAFVGFLAVPAICQQVGNSSIGQYSLLPVDNLLSEAFGKVTFNCATQEFHCRAHGLTPGVYYTLLFGGTFPYETLGEATIAVGGGPADDKGNVNIKGVISNADLQDIISHGRRWNLWITNESGIPASSDLANRVLRSENPITCP